MCVPEVFIRDDGRGFVVRKGGVDWVITETKNFKPWQAVSLGAWGRGKTIMEAVDNALAKLRAEEKSVNKG